MKEPEQPQQYYAVELTCRIVETDKTGNQVYSGGQGLELRNHVRLLPNCNAQHLFTVLQKVYAFCDDLRQRQQ